MNYRARVKKQNPYIEEEITIEINKLEFTGFASICPYPIEEDDFYPVKISFTILDKLEVRELNENIKELERVGTGYNYFIRGTLNETFIDAGINIYDEDGYFYDYLYLLGKPVEIKVDRIEVELLNSNNNI